MEITSRIYVDNCLHIKVCNTMNCSCPAFPRTRAMILKVYLFPNQQDQHYLELLRNTILEPHSRPPKSETVEWGPGTYVSTSPSRYSDAHTNSGITDLENSGNIRD